MAVPQDTDWCRHNSWFQRHGRGRIKGNTHFLVTSAVARSETSGRKAWHRGSGGRTLRQPWMPALSNWGAAGHLDRGVNFKSICIHWSTSEFRTALRTLQNWLLGEHKTWGNTRRLHKQSLPDFGEKDIKQSREGKCSPTDADCTRPLAFRIGHQALACVAGQCRCS